jgi:hypothetical protein
MRCTAFCVVALWRIALTMATLTIMLIALVLLIVFTL